jgi:hypothetical protein
MDSSSHREVAVATYNRCWELLELARRTPDEDVELLTSAFVSRYHWTFVGGHVPMICADWMISRVAAALGEGGLAISYALRATTRAQASDTDDWLVASSAEGLARAYAAAGEQERRDEWCATAQRLVNEIADDEDRELIASQLASVPRWVSPT